jgi:hypothetical protein
MTNVAYMYAKARLHFVQGDIPWKAATSTMYAALYTSSASPDQAADETYNNTNELSTANGYTQGGLQMTLNDPTIVGSAPNAYAKLYCSDMTWGPTASFTGVRTVKIYNNTGSKYLVGYITYDADKAAQGGNFTVPCPSAGLFDV